MIEDGATPDDAAGGDRDGRLARARPRRAAPTSTPTRSRSPGPPRALASDGFATGGDRPPSLARRRPRPPPDDPARRDGDGRARSTSRVIAALAAGRRRPIVMPLSNPTTLVRGDPGRHPALVRRPGDRRDGLAVRRRSSTTAGATRSARRTTSSCSRASGSARSSPRRGAMPDRLFLVAAADARRRRCRTSGWRPARSTRPSIGCGR